MARNSIREQILLAVLATIAPAAKSFGAGLYRSPTVAITREQSPALVVFPESDAIAERANNRVTRELTIRMVALTRVVPPDAPETQADALMTAAHAALMDNLNLGGLALGIREQGCEWDVEDADAVAAEVSARYCITYRTLANDLSVPG